MKSSTDAARCGDGWSSTRGGRGERERDPPIPIATIPTATPLDRHSPTFPFLTSCRDMAGPSPYTTRGDPIPSLHTTSPHSTPHHRTPVHRNPVPRSFTERGDERFVEEAIGLLMGFFRYVGPGDDTGIPVGSQGWDVEHSLSDRQIGRLLSICRKASNLDIAASVSMLLPPPPPPPPLRLSMPSILAQSCHHVPPLRKPAPLPSLPHLRASLHTTAISRLHLPLHQLLSPFLFLFLLGDDDDDDHDDDQGKLVDTGISRSNQDGALDEGQSICPEWCVVM